MNSIRLKESWKNTQTHALLSKNLIVDSTGDKFRINNLKVRLYKKGWGVHFQFQLDGINHFVSITHDNLLNTFDEDYFEENAVYNLIVENSYYKKTPCLLICKNNFRSKIFTLLQICKYRTII